MGEPVNQPTGGFGKAQAEDWDTWYTRLGGAL